MKFLQLLTTTLKEADNRIPSYTIYSNFPLKASYFVHANSKYSTRVLKLKKTGYLSSQDFCKIQLLDRCRTHLQTSTKPFENTRPITILTSLTLKMVLTPMVNCQFSSSMYEREEIFTNPLALDLSLSHCSPPLHQSSTLVSSRSILFLMIREILRQHVMRIEFEQKKTPSVSKCSYWQARHRLQQCHDCTLYSFLLFIQQKFKQ